MIKYHQNQGTRHKQEKVANKNDKLFTIAIGKSYIKKALNNFRSLQLFIRNTYRYE